jgi:hypothetical protein
MAAFTIVFQAIKRLIGTILNQGQTLLFMTGMFSWDFVLKLLNMVLPRRRVGQGIQPGMPGYRGIWPEYRKPEDTDSRSPCPALNALANHGILPRNGRHIKWTDMSKAVKSAYNLSPSMVIHIPVASATLFEKNYFTDYFDLSDLNCHNGIEHDASLTRHDTAFQPDQGKPALDLVRDLLSRGKSAGKGKPRYITPATIAAFSAERRAHSQSHNGQYTLGAFHKFFSASNSAIMYDTFAGNVDDLSTWLEEERIPDGWEPAVRGPFGLTITDLHLRVAEIEFQTVHHGPVVKHA